RHENQLYKPLVSLLPFPWYRDPILVFDKMVANYELNRLHLPFVMVGNGSVYVFFLLYQRIDQGEGVDLIKSFYRQKHVDMLYIRIGCKVVEGDLRHLAGKMKPLSSFKLLSLLFIDRPQFCFCLHCVLE